MHVWCPSVHRAPGKNSQVRVTWDIGSRQMITHLEITNCDFKIVDAMAKGPGKQPAEARLNVPIHKIRGQRVLLDRDVADLFGVELRALNQQVSRNPDKFADFAFRLTKEELDDLKSQNVISSGDWGGARKAPRAFTEHGVVMAATVVRSEKAMAATRVVVKTFVQARRQASELAENQANQADGQISFPLHFRNEVMTKVSLAIGHVLDAMTNPDEMKAARKEARGALTESVKALKELVKKPGVENEQKIAQIRKLMAEAESIEVDTEGKRLRNEEQHLSLLARKLSLIMQAHHFAETGNAEQFFRVLGSFEQPLGITDDRDKT